MSLFKMGKVINFLVRAGKLIVRGLAASAKDSSSVTFCLIQCNEPEISRRTFVPNIPQGVIGKFSRTK